MREMVTMYSCISAASFTICLQLFNVCVCLHAAPSPSARWGHTMLLTDPLSAILIGGQGDKQQLSKDSVWTLHTGQCFAYQYHYHVDQECYPVKPTNST
jgi:hypothetical protein